MGKGRDNLRSFRKVIFHITRIHFNVEYIKRYDFQIYPEGRVLTTVLTKVCYEACKI